MLALYVDCPDNQYGLLRLLTIICISGIVHMVAFVSLLLKKIMMMMMMVSRSLKVTNNYTNFWSFYMAQYKTEKSPMVISRTHQW